ncbi:hypothetical protein Fmac_021561 [Flemingia macrophylla]|uniref:Uncharacterized protein n=1 Tax=Flemingia macrophylla TaxID=520843 RepID=A0ABD1LXB5_9FABA
MKVSFRSLFNPSERNKAVTVRRDKHAVAVAVAVVMSLLAATSMLPEFDLTSSYFFHFLIWLLRLDLSSLVFPFFVLVHVVGS